MITNNNCSESADPRYFRRELGLLLIRLHSGRRRLSLDAMRYGTKASEMQTPLHHPLTPVRTGWSFHSTSGIGPVTCESQVAVQTLS